MIKRLLVTVFLALALAFNNAMAKELDAAVNAMRTGDFAEAYCIMRPLAESGDAEAQYNIGWMYLNGYGLRVNDTLALEWWQKASQQGHIDASFSIGMLYSLGEGKVAKNLNNAIDYYLLAAQSGHEDAITLVQSMMMRNDRAIRSRLHSIVNQHDFLLGVKRQVKTTKLNARSRASVKSHVLATLVKGQVLLELFKQGKWSQVIVLGNEDIDQTVWVYNPMLEEYVDNTAEDLSSPDVMSDEQIADEVTAVEIMPVDAAADDTNNLEVVSEEPKVVEMIKEDLTTVDEMPAAPDLAK